VVVSADGIRSSPADNDDVDKVDIKSTTLVSRLHRLLFQRSRAVVAGSRRVDD